ncbi:hypothetical protein VTN49DRAFT_3317 [Thermomyces lanuginosus]|uniref:uncharacterized protein n=1 Tax=Thermomyces lanuginosus TaxID=5541 RepID=UPI0037438034
MEVVRAPRRAELPCEARGSFGFERGLVFALLVFLTLACGAWSKLLGSMDSESRSTPNFAGHGKRKKRIDRAEGRVKTVTEFYDVRKLYSGNSTEID